MSLLDVKSVSKRYPGVVALDDVHLTLEAGEILCLLGENGAGKSTLGKIIAGALLPDVGTILIDGEPAEIHSPAQALAAGIGMIYQERTLVPGLSAAENIYLGREPRMKSGLIDRKKLADDARVILREFDDEVDPIARVETMSVAQQQTVEIAKAVSRNVRILLLDEPTAPLSVVESQKLFTVLRRLRSNGVGIIYVSHRLPELFEIGDRVVVLRDGRNVADFSAKTTTREDLIRAMVGRPLTEEFPESALTRGEEVLRVHHCTNDRVHDISFSLSKGEILGIGGLAGSGRTEILRALFGADPVFGGEVLIHDVPLKISSPREAVRAGIAFLPEDRNLQGLFLQMNVRENISISSLQSFVRGFRIDREKEESSVRELFESLAVKAPSPEAGVDTLSGGNRQKVILARWLLANARVLLVDEPTAGIDVGVKREIYATLQRLAQNGIGIIVVTSDLEELLGLCTRILVVREGRISGELEAREATQEAVMHLATAAA